MLKKLIFPAIFLVISVTNLPAQTKNNDTRITLPMEVLKDKIKGGWAGQTIGVTFGGPYEFRFQGTFIEDRQPLHWKPGQVKDAMLNSPGLFDDLYMDLSFVEVIERLGQDAPVDSFASVFAHAGYDLWHANQAARYNILNGIPAPKSGHWLHNPHADDIDYQIEADYAGLMSPGMPNTASAISDRIGHIMNYGDGWYAGVFVGAMYAEAFLHKDIATVVEKALLTIPEKSTFRQCISDVIRWHAQYPNDWKQAWFEIQKKWSSEVGCPDGIFNAFNIDAKINSAYVVMGLLYGNGDYGKTLDVSTRCGQDADCNPSTAGGILGTLLGYEKIPANWKSGLEGSEDIPFKYTSTSLNRVYDMGVRHALENIRRQGGTTTATSVSIPVQEPKVVAWEESFPGMAPSDKISFWRDDLKQESFEFEGTGLIIRGEASKEAGAEKNTSVTAEVWIDGKNTGSFRMPADFTTRKHEIYWNYQLGKGKHTAIIKRTDNDTHTKLRTWEYITINGK